MKILIIEDEQGLRESIEEYFTEAGNICETASDYATALSKINIYRYDCILLDITLPGGNGIDLLRTVKDHNYSDGVLIISAKNSLDDKLEGLDLGADDYLVKPFGLKELFSRIRAVLRRRKITEPDIVKVANLVMDKKKHEVTRAGILIHLAPIEYKLLDTLISNKGEAISRKRLIEHAWGPDFKEANNELNVHIKYLRNKIDGKKNKPLIHTIRGIGFVLKE